MQPQSLYPPGFRTALVAPNKRQKRKIRRCVSMPKANVGPHARLVFAELARQQITYDMASEVSGVRRATLKSWRQKCRPGLESIEAVLATLGFGFVPVPALEALPPELAGEVTALALKLGMNMPRTWSALIDSGVEQRLLRMRAEERAAIMAEHDVRRANCPANDNTKQAAAPTLS
jgi:hypothetical protein